MAGGQALQRINRKDRPQSGWTVTAAVDRGGVRVLRQKGELGDGGDDGREDERKSAAAVAMSMKSFAQMARLGHVLRVQQVIWTAPIQNNLASIAAARHASIVYGQVRGPREAV